jgi:hypothetical protein
MWKEVQNQAEWLIHCGLLPLVDKQEQRKVRSIKEAQQKRSKASIKLPSEVQEEWCKLKEAQTATQQPRHSPQYQGRILGDPFFPPKSKEQLIKRENCTATSKFISIVAIVWCAAMHSNAQQCAAMRSIKEAHMKQIEVQKRNTAMRSREAQIAQQGSTIKPNMVSWSELEAIKNPNNNHVSRASCALPRPYLERNFPFCGRGQCKSRHPIGPEADKSGQMGRRTILRILLRIVLM